IAAVNGAALGGGCELAISCDMIVASDNAQFGQPEIQLSLFPGPAVVALPRLIGKQKAFEMLLSGDPISAQEAERIGLVNKIIPKADFEQGVDEFVSRLKGKSLAALKLTRYAIYQARDLECNKANQCVSDIYLGLLMHTEDAVEGISSFLEKRKPVWKNK
ncbi:MAG: enoyl-CoA hydratase-related protein, partial [Dehalococcoidia bacterium]|nr:enoyl-CoA hydratase-related protein [Dehalococcoidia bacterium]